MSKRILIVESDSTLSRNMRGALEKKGFAVDETTDGKGCVELIRRLRPDLVLLAVDLAANQNGYLLCGKLKKDDDLKAIPVVIVGSPDGFNQHKKLKTRADDYVAKPVDLPSMVTSVGGIIGLPDAGAADVVEDESLTLSELVEDDGGTELPAEEIAVDASDDGTMGGDPALDMLDAAFDDISAPNGSAHEEEPVEAPPEVEEEVSGFETLGDDGDEVAVEAEADSALDSLGASPEVIEEEAPAAFPSPVPPPAAAPPARTSSFSNSSRPPPGGMSPAEAAELRELRTRVRELESALTDANERASEADNRRQQLEGELSAKSAEAEAAKSAGAAGGKSDKEFFALREAGNKKDKEILRLKSELNQKDQEIVELKDREMQLEQQASEASGEMARRDAQIKTLSTRADQLGGDRKRMDQQLMAAKDEARGATAKLSTLQAELEEASNRLAGADGELNDLRARTQELETAVTQAREDADSARREADDARQGVQGELEELRGQLEQSQGQLTSQATAFAEEAASLRRRVSELEDTANKHEDRVTKLYGRIKGDEKIREKTKKALSIALQLLEEQQALPSEDDEPAVA